MSLKKQPLIDKEMVIPFWLLTSCFVVWGLAQDLTAPLVTAFKGIFTMSTFEASLVQFAYFGAYFCLALPTAFLNQRFGYKVGVLTGLGLAAIGALGFYPAAKSLTFGFFLIALFILAAGLSVLETSANPFAIAMGPGGHRDQAAQPGAVVQPARNQPGCAAGRRPRPAEDEPGHG